MSIDVNSVKKGDQMYEGKAKKIFATSNPDLVIMEYKDSATAFNGEKKGEIDEKGILNNTIAASIFQMLNQKGIPTHFIAKLNDREVLCKKVSIVPLEVIVRNVAAGSFSKRLAVPEGSELKTTIFELSYKDDELGDPLINDYHA
ncbi:MAG: phosphoribosylaminoimidazolesuccinocarboxamide synthase, partial [Spirochaetaceae bacterium]|nr:phosphoribosylaminoimidazolesuccinocarboxamide synthase [Spirochaetaceae bacterium]